MKKRIKVGYCVAYDWYLLQYSLPAIYDAADEICLSVDQNCVSWTGKPFAFDEKAFAELVASVDRDKKIKIYRDNFYLPELQPMQNEVRQRNMIATFMGKQNAWHVQLDADEYFLDFSAFVNRLHRIKTSRKVNVCCPFVILFKKVDHGFLYVKNKRLSKQEIIPVATNFPHYEFGRKNGYFNMVTDAAVIHQSWARSEEEIMQKLENWGHNKDFDVHEYFRFWKNLNEEEYGALRNFHPFTPAAWEALGFVPCASVADLVANTRTEHFFKMPAWRMMVKNSVWVSRLKKFLP